MATKILDCAVGITLFTSSPERLGSRRLRVQSSTTDLQHCMEQSKLA
jgi:hypothetical protein